MKDVTPTSDTAKFWRLQPGGASVYWGSITYAYNNIWIGSSEISNKGLPTVKLNKIKKTSRVMLAFDGGHLGSARENLRMLTLLEEKQKSLEQNLQAVKLEQQMLKVLCKDSTSVYRVDLMNDRAEIVKIEEHSNFAGDLLPHGPL